MKTTTAKRRNFMIATGVIAAVMSVIGGIATATCDTELVQNCGMPAAVLFYSTIWAGMYFILWMTLNCKD